MTERWLMLRSFILIWFLHRTTCLQAGQEPVCSSRFDYESKLLERMIMVEHRMKLLQESTKKEIDDLQEEKRSLLDTVKNLKKQLEGEQESKLEQLGQMAEILVINATYKMEEMSTLSRQLMEVKETVVADMNTKLDLKFNASIKDIYDKTVKPAVVFHMLHPSDTSPGPYNSILKFTTAKINTDKLYDPSSGYFTAPTDGVDMFAVQICGYQSKYINFRLYVNDDYISDTTQYDKASQNHCSSTNAAAALNKGDKVCVKTGPQTNSASNTVLYSQTSRWSTFTGALVNCFGNINYVQICLLLTPDDI